MEASQSRELSKASATKEINGTIKKIKDACKNQLTHIELKGLSEGTMAWLIDNNYKVTTNEVMVSHGRAIVWKIEIEW